MSETDNLFAELAAAAGVSVITTTRIMPDRIKTTGPRTGKHLGASAQKAGDCYWDAALQVAKVVYTRIDERYANRILDEKQRKSHAVKMGEAKKIIQEHRNQIFEAVLPLFHVADRKTGDQWAVFDPDSADKQSADKHAQDYFVRGVYHQMVETYIAWLPEFLGATNNDEALRDTEATIRRVAEAQKKTLASKLMNFKFNFLIIPLKGKKS